MPSIGETRASETESARLQRLCAPEVVEALRSVRESNPEAFGVIFPEWQAGARARLFLAALDLAEALRDLLPWAKANHDGAGTCDCDRCEKVRAAEDALAKAGGR